MNTRFGVLLNEAFCDALHMGIRQGLNLKIPLNSHGRPVVIRRDNRVTTTTTGRNRDGTRLP